MYEITTIEMKGHCDSYEDFKENLDNINKIGDIHSCIYDGGKDIFNIVYCPTILNKQVCCRDCKYYYTDKSMLKGDHICTNPKSDKVADFVSEYDWCDAGTPS